jgi:hypothetical protein
MPHSATQAAVNLERKSVGVLLLLLLLVLLLGISIVGYQGRTKKTLLKKVLGPLKKVKGQNYPLIHRGRECTSKGGQSSKIAYEM